MVAQRRIPWHELRLAKRKHLFTLCITTVTHVKVPCQNPGSFRVSHQALPSTRATVILSMPRNYSPGISLRKASMSRPRSNSSNLPGQSRSTFHFCRGQSILLPRNQQLWCLCRKKSHPTQINLIADEAAPVEHTLLIYRR